MNEAPREIWLQWDDGFEPYNMNGEDVTWCVDQVNDEDARYIRADAVGPDADIRQTLEAGLNKLAYFMGQDEIEKAREWLKGVGVVGGVTPTPTGAGV